MTKISRKARLFMEAVATGLVACNLLVIYATSAVVDRVGKLLVPTLVVVWLALTMVGAYEEVAFFIPSLPSLFFP